MYSIEDLFQILEDFIQFFDDFNLVEKQKLEAAVKNDILAIEEIMKKEQADILRFRGMDKKREEIQKALSWGGLTYKEIIPKLEGEAREKAENLYSRLNASVKIYRNTFDSARSVIQTNLHTVDKTIREWEDKNTKGNGRVYQSNGKASRSPNNITNRRI